MFQRCFILSAGSIGQTTISDNGPVRTEFADYKSWNGGDGKYDALGKPKWNAYAMTSTKSTRIRNTDTGNILDCMVDVPFDFGDISNLELRALNGLASDIKGFDFNALVAYGERAQTIDLVLSSVKSLVSCVKHAKRGDITGALRAVGYSGIIPKKHRFNHEDVASRFLEIQYGWKPLLADVYGSMDAYHKLTQGPRIKTFKSNSASNQVVALSHPKGNTQQALNSRVVYYAKLSEPPSTARQLGLLNPVNLAWELLPFSFVADWFIPVGSYLDSTGFFLGLEGSFLKTTVHKGTMVQVGTSLWSGMKSEARYAEMQRSLLSSLSVPTPAFKPLDKALSTEHFWNATALLTSIIGGASRVK